MTLPFDPNSLFTAAGADQTIDQGQTGQAGGFIAPTPTPTPTIEPQQTAFTGECTIGGFDCPPGTICQAVETGVTSFGIAVYTTTCVDIPSPTTTTTTGVTTTCEPVGTFLGCTQFEGIAEFSNGIQNGTCSSFTRVDARCAPPPPPAPTPLCQDNTFQCGPTVQVDAINQKATCCPTGNTCCFGAPALVDGEWTTVEAEGSFCWDGPCPGTKNRLPVCTYESTTFPCSDILGEEYTGNVTQIIKTSTNKCEADPQVNLQANISQCKKKETQFCEYVTEEIACTSLPAGTFFQTTANITGNATRNVIKTDAQGNPLPLGCQANPSISTEWNTNKCKGELPPPPEQYRLCGVSSNFTYVTELPEGYGSAYDNYGVCYGKVWVNCGNPTFNNLGNPPGNYVYNQSGNCWASPIEPPPPPITGVVVGTGICTPPIGGFNKTRDIPCVNLGSQYVGGIAKQQQVRSYDSTGPENTICEYTDWQDSGVPDTSFCKVANVPQACTPPDGPSTRDVSIPCSQVDKKYTKGTATQKQVRRVDTTTTGPGTCPYTWENSGVPDTSACQVPTFWRNCITGELIEGTPPSDFIQSAYDKGGSCWEPITDLGFTPSLSQALRYTYQRGSSKFPETKTITVSNTSYGQAYTVKITTNENITLSTNKAQSGKGAISFIIEPRSEVKLFVAITAELLQQLQDGLSTLSMAVEYDRVL